ncbi:hypothetical protein [Citrobacter amalonaticus]|uniref:hypothetical protein n=1 Tax=Citrobacter amalonaticus TaxID=35703 RepID=UPI0011AF7A72|nr:hypothetical protein [Citrobacter amalonaticus]EJZ7017969.1 hypothetical protein [Salmonella enterica]
MKKSLLLIICLSGCQSALNATHPDIIGYTNKTVKQYMSCVVDKYSPLGFSLSQVTIEGGESLRLAGGVVVLNVTQAGQGAEFKLYKTHAPIELYPKAIDLSTTDCR